MAQRESLSIQVTETGSSHVADMFDKIAKEANKASKAVAAMRKQIGGKGTIKEGTKKGGKDKSVDEAKKSQKQIDAAYSASQKKRREESAKSWKAEVANNQKIVSDHVKSQKKLREEGDKTWKAEVANNKKMAASAVAEQQKIRSARDKTWKDARAKHMSRAKAGNAANKKVASDHARAQKTLRSEGAKTWKMEVAGNIRAAKAHDRATAAANKHRLSMRKLGGAVEKNTTGVRALGNSVYFAQRAFAALGGVMILRGYLAMTDAFQNMNNRLKLVTTSAGHLGDTQKELFAIAKNTRQSVKDTVETYVRLNLSLKNAGVSQKRLMGVMSTLNKMLAVSGASAIEASQSIRQLSQAFSKGKLDGDEFRSVSEAMPSILTALETSLGKTRGELRAMSEQGLITGEVLLDAFEAVKTSVDQDFANSIVTLGQAWTVLKDEVLKAVGSFNVASGVGGLVVKAVMLVADTLWVVVAALKVLFYWLMFKMAAALAAMVLKTILWSRTLTGTLIPSLLATTARMLKIVWAGKLMAAVAAAGAGPFGLLAAAILAVVYAGYRLFKWMTTLGPEANKFDKEINKNNRSIKELEKTIAHMRQIDPSDERIKKLEKEITLLEKRNELEGKDKLIAGAIEEAAAMDKKLTDGMFSSRLKIAQLQHELSTGFTGVIHDGPGGGGSKAEKTTRSNSEIKEAIALAEDELEVIRNKIALRAAEAEAANELAKEAELISDLKIEYKKLQVTMAKSSSKMQEYRKGVNLLETLHRKEILTIDDMIHGLRKLKNAYSDLHPEMAAVKVLKDTKDDIAAAEVARELAKANGASKEAIKAAGVEAKIVNKEFREFTEGGYKQLEGLPQWEWRVGVDNMLKGRKEFLAARAETRKLLKDEADLGDKKKGKKKKDRTPDSLAAFVASMNPVFAAEQRITKATTMLNDAWNKGIPITADVNAAYKELQKRTENARLPTEHLRDLMNDMIATQHLSTDELEKLNAETAERDRLLAKGATEAEIKVFMDLTKVIKEQRKAREANGRAALIEAPPDFAKGHDSRRGYSERAALAQATSVQDHNRLLINHELIAARRELQQALTDGNIAEKDYIILTQQATEEARRATRATELWGGALQGVAEHLTDVAIEDMWIGSVTTAYMAMEDAMVKGIIQIEGALFDMMSGATTGWDKFTEGMKDLFKTAVDSIVEDLTRVLVRMATMKVLNAVLSVGGEGNLEGATEEATTPEEAKDAGLLAATQASAGMAQASAFEAEAAALGASGSVTTQALANTVLMKQFSFASQAAISAAQAAAAQAGIAAAAAQSALAAMQAKEVGSTLTAIGSSAAARHGATFNSANLPHFANGGSMQVGGSGGPDTKLVQFMASPGENVHVTNPGQSRLDNRQAPPAAPPVIHVNNFSDPSEVPAAMASSSGERVIMNTIQNNAELLARMLK